VDDEGFVVKSVSEEVDPYEAPEVESDYFKIKTVECESKNIVHVYFTQPVDINAALVLHYEILQNGQTVAYGNYSDMEAAVLGSDDSAVALYTKNFEFDDDGYYTLKVQGSLTSAYGVNINDGEAMTMDFMGDDSSNRSLKVSSVRAISKDTVRVTFNQDVDSGLATNIANYSLRNKTESRMSAVLGASMYGVGDDRYRVVDLKVIDLETNDIYELTVLNARDVFKISTLNNEEELFTAKDYASSDVELDYVIPMSETRLHLYFNRPLSPASIAANITGVNDVLVIYNPSDNYRLTVYLDKDHPLEDNEDYTLKITSGIVEIDGQVQTRTLSEEFEGIDDKEELIDIDDARFVGTGKVRIEFDTEVSVSNNASQYRLQYKNDLGHDVSITADSVNYIDPLTVVASFSNLPDESYDVVLYNMVDPSNQYTTQLITANVTKE